MTQNNKTMSRGFIFAGLMNLTVLIFSRFFTNPVIAEADPIVMSNFGLLMIVIWGLAYMSVSKKYTQVKWLIAVFAVEKLIYGIIWTKWIISNDVGSVFSKDAMAGTFFSIYGISDWLFFIFFSFVFIRVLNKRNKMTAE